METMKYTNAKESVMENKGHTIHIEIDDKEVASADYEYFSKPVSFYYIKKINTHPEYQKEGYGTKIIEAIENRLLKKKKIGVLDDVISSDSHACGWYEKRGWKKVSTSNTMYVFNMPEDINPEILNRFEKRYLEEEERDGYQKSSELLEL